MKILGINRVELVLEDPDEAAETLSELLGMHFGTDVTEEHGVLSRTDFRAGLELAGPKGPTSAMRPILDQRGEGLLTTVFRVESVEDVLETARRNGIEVLVDLDKGSAIPGYKSYRQVSLRSDRFPAGVSFTFAEYEEE